MHPMLQLPLPILFLIAGHIAADVWLGVLMVTHLKVRSEINDFILLPLIVSQVCLVSIWFVVGRPPLILRTILFAATMFATTAYVVFLFLEPMPPVLFRLFLTFVGSLALSCIIPLPCLRLLGAGRLTHIDAPEIEIPAVWQFQLRELFVFVTGAACTCI